MSANDFGAPKTQGRVIKAHSRVSAQNLALLAKRVGRCGDIDVLTGFVCVTQPHESDCEHMAVQIGGPADGYVYHTWGGDKRNTNLIATQELPTDG